MSLRVYTSLGTLCNQKSAAMFLGKEYESSTALDKSNQEHA